MSHQHLLNLLPYCITKNEEAFINARAKGLTWVEASNEIDVDVRTVQRGIKRITERAETKGFSPEHDMVHPVADSYIAKGVSTLYNRDGKVTAQWVKATLDDAKYRELLKEAAQAFSETIKPEKPVTITSHTEDTLLNLYPITDFHMGAKVWGEECGEDWDLKIAEDLLVKWFATAIKQSPNASTGCLAIMGDFLHLDSLEALTPTGKNLLDSDTRFQLIVRVAIRSLRRVISLLLQKHQKLHVIVAEGNHDMASSVWLREMLEALYVDEPRIVVDTSPDIFYCYEHGSTSLFIHHGHRAKFDSIDDVMVSKFREVFGRTKFSYAHMGHYHHARVKESNLMVVEQHRTLTAKDSYSSRSGYMSGRDAKVITYHKNFGEVARVTISPNMVYNSD